MVEFEVDKNLVGSKLIRTPDNKVVKIVAVWLERHTDRFASMLVMTVDEHGDFQKIALPNPNWSLLRPV